MPLSTMEGHFVTGFGDGTGSGDIQLMPGAVDEASPFLERTLKPLLASTGWPT